MRFTSSFYEDVGQEQTEFDNWYIKSETKNILKIVYSSNDNTEVSSSIKFDTLNNILYYNEYRYMDSIQAINLPYVIEECEKCHETSLCIEWKKSGEWKDFIASQLPLKYMLSKKNVKSNLTIFDEEAFKRWQGNYGFGFGGNHMGESYEGSGDIEVNSEGKSSITISWEKINDETQKLIDEGEFKTVLSIYNVSKDTLELRGKGDNKQYILYKTTFIVDGEKTDGYAIKGHSVYMLSPPNNDYPLTKSKQ